MDVVHAMVHALTTASVLSLAGCFRSNIFRQLLTVDSQVYMDDLTDRDEAIGKVKVAVLVPTCGEKTSVMLKALFGNLQLR